jgi:hypothetical protein
MMLTRIPPLVLFLFLFLATTCSHDLCRMLAFAEQRPSLLQAQHDQHHQPPPQHRRVRVAAISQHQVDVLLAQGNFNGALRRAYYAPQTECLVYYFCEAANLTAVVLQRRKKMACKTLLTLIDRLCAHITGNTDAAQNVTIFEMDSRHWQEHDGSQIT